jgi:hypothetical protein
MGMVPQLTRRSRKTNWYVTGTGYYSLPVTLSRIFLKKISCGSADCQSAQAGSLRYARNQETTENSFFLIQPRLIRFRGRTEKE